MGNKDNEIKRLILHDIKTDDAAKTARVPPWFLRASELLSGLLSQLLQYLEIKARTAT